MRKWRYRGAVCLMVVMLMALFPNTVKAQETKPLLEVSFEKDYYEAGEIATGKIYVKNAEFNTVGFSLSYSTSQMTAVTSQGQASDQPAQLIPITNSYDENKGTGYFSVLSRKADLSKGNLSAALYVHPLTNAKSVRADDSGMQIATVQFKMNTAGKPSLEFATVEGDAEFSQRSFFILYDNKQPEEATATIVYGKSGSEEPVKVPNITYRTHVQTYGWQDWVNNGTMSGTEGLGKRLEGIEIKLEGNANVGIQYQTHVQTYGWQDWVSNGAMSGTEGEAKRLEAIRIQLTGTEATKYDIYYRVHAQSYGWLDWAKNGEAAGTAGYSKRLEAIEIVVVKKGESAPGSTERPYIERPGDLAYRTHVQSYGWQNWVKDGAMSGTEGEYKRLEGIQIRLDNPSVSGDIIYRTHVQTYGWQDWVSNGTMSGTEGEYKRLEAIQIKLNGELAKNYDIYYRVHAQSYGWLGWAKNGEAAGTEGLSKRLEAIEIQIVPKGAMAPGSTDQAFVK